MLTQGSNTARVQAHLQLLHASAQRRLTIRSTGPIAACRHLGYKGPAQMPARRNGPVSSNVRPHIFNAVLRHRSRIQSIGNTLLLQDCEMSERNPVPKLFQAARNKLVRQEATRGIGNRETMCLTAKDMQTITRSAYVVAPRKSFKFLGGASRRCAAPRSHSSGAA